MRLSEFIQKNHKSIIEDWVDFARTMYPWSEGMSETDLRDHAGELLTAVVRDMNSPQSLTQKSEKSKGNGVDGELARIGQKHASDRLETGLNLNQLVSEFRALRASVLSLWNESHGDVQGEVTRFNEAIDETLATSTCRYSETVENTREQFLGILGHDLRNPISAIIMGATLLTDSADSETSAIARSILNTGNRMNRMVNDLLDLTRTRLGAGIPVQLETIDFNAMCHNVISELQLAHPNHELEFEPVGHLIGEWDRDRLAQVVSNLVGNAIQYGAQGKVVKISVRANEKDVILEVHNEGLAIPEKVMKTIFSPMARYHIGNQNVTGLGLGLFIASEIVTAHGGKISVGSDETNGTTFTVTLPRHAPSKTPSTN